MSKNKKPDRDATAANPASDTANASKDAAGAKKPAAKKAVAKKPAAKKAARKATGKKTGAKPAAEAAASAPAPAPAAAPTPAPASAPAAAASPAPAPPRSPAPATAPVKAPPPPAPAPAPSSAPPGPRRLIRVTMPVRWRDLDAFNHVNNSKYLSYLEEARLHWMMSVPGMGMDDHVAPVVAAAQLNYRRPITWPSQVLIELFVERLGNTSLTVGHRIVDAEDAGVMYCDGHVVMVWIDRDSGAAAALPEAVREACTA